MSIKDIAGKDPFPVYDELRSEGGAIWDEGLHGWLITDFRGCSEVARLEGRTFVPPWGEIPGGREILGHHGLYLLRGDEHRQFHVALQQWFNRATADKEVAQGIRRIFDDIVSDLELPGRVEFWSQVAEVLPGLVMLQLLGLPVEESLRAKLVDLNHYLNTWFGSFGTSEQNRVEASAATDEVFRLIGPTIRARRDEPAADLISELWRIGSELFSDWNDQDIVRYVFFFVGAGTVNTSTMLSALAFMLVTTPDLSENITKDPSLTPTLVEEALRLWGPVQLRIRKATKDVEISGSHIQKDDIVYPVLGSANRDPNQFSCPNDLDLKRNRPRGHLAFYAGSRLCLGAGLARLEATESITAFLQHFPNARLAPGSSAPQFVGLTYRNLKPLELIYDVPE